jgi:hypothetical protein
VAYNRDTARIERELRRALDGMLAAQTRELTSAWVRGFDVLMPAFVAGLQDLIAAVEAGEIPSRALVERTARLQDAVTLAQRRLEDLAQQSSVTISTDLDDVTAMAAQAQPLLVASQLPEGVGLARVFGRLDPGALAAIVQRTTQQITALHYPLADVATERMQRELVRGISVGDNPRTAARRMLQGVEREWNGGLTRALTISRTEMLDAHREASAAGRRATGDVVTGWRWLAQLDTRTCPACWVMHDSVHGNDEDGPNDHQQGRCIASPITKSWADLGYDIPEPPSLVRDARAAFMDLPRADQLTIMGPARLDAFLSGRVSWSDLATVRHTDGWRDSVVPTPVRQLASA